MSKLFGKTLNIGYLEPEVIQILKALKKTYKNRRVSKE
jgi:hypothetical protein